MKIAFDVKLRRPACAILQAVYGGDEHALARFDADTWLVNPTPDIKLYEVTTEQLKQLVVMAERAVNIK